MQKRYIVDGNLKDDTGYHTTGDSILMDEDVAVPLVAIGRLTPAVADLTLPEASAQSDPEIPGGDGFPVHGINQTAPASQPAAPIAPVANTPANPPANGDEKVPVQSAPASPTPEQIARDMEQIR
jgi:hypothetical protein